MTERALPVTILEPAGIDPELLDHSLSLRFDLGQFDPRITFTRNSYATYFGSDGLLKTAAANEPRIDYDPVTGECKGFLVEDSRTNLLPYSEQLDIAAWVKGISTITPAAITSPDGTLSGAKLTFNAGASTSTSNVSQTVSVNAETFYTISLFAKAELFDEVRFALITRTAANVYVGEVNYIFNLTAGTATVSALGGTPPTDASASIIHVGGGWYRCSITAKTTSTVGRITHIARNNKIGDGTSGIYIWGAQLEAGAFPTSYIPTPAVFTSRNSTGTYFDSTGLLKTAAINEARYDHALVDGEWVSKGLVLEKSSTNLFWRSEALDLWSMNPSPNDAIILPNATVAPDGTTTADKHVPTATNGGHVVYRTFAGGINKTYTASVFVKAAEYRYASIGLGNSGFSNINTDAVFDLSTGALVFTRGAPVQASATKLKDGWWRISVSVMSGSSVGAYVANASILAAPSTGSFAGDGVSGGYVWGMQVEEIPAGESLLPSSYIKTEAASVTRAADLSTSSAATRAADSAVMTGANFSSWYRQDEGTLFAETKRAPAFPASIAFLSNGTDGTSRVQFSFGLSTQPSIAVVKEGVTLNAGISSPYTGSELMLGVAMQSGSYSTSSNGSLVSALVSAMPLVTALYIGRSHVGTPFLNTHIKRLSYYPKRLPNAKLQAITQ